MLCARCHPHPLENWTQADYYGLASFFNQVSARPDRALSRRGQHQAGAAEPRSRRRRPTRAPAGRSRRSSSAARSRSWPATIDRREAYAKWLTSPENPFFARGLVNRIWSYFFHRGIIEPVDDIRSTNPPINPALLDALTKDFIDAQVRRPAPDAADRHRRDVPAHQRRRTPSNRTTSRTSRTRIPRRVPAEALLDSLVQATGVPENFGGAPGGFRAAQLPDANVRERRSSSLFGKPQRMEACECERDNSSNMLQALHFINGKSILGRVQNPGGRVAQLLKQKLADEQLVDRAVPLVAGPPPQPRKSSRSHGNSSPPTASKQAEAAQDLMWALLNSKDFLLVH